MKTPSYLLSTLIAASLFTTSCQEAVVVEKIMTEYQEEKKKEDQKIREEKLEEAKNGHFSKKNEGSNTTSDYTLKDGMMEGLAVQRYDDGSVWKESHYKDGKLHGTAKVYDRKGKLERSVTYAEGKKNGPYIKYFSSGKPKVELEYSEELPMPGIVERGYKGEILEQPKIVVREEDRLLKDNTYFFHIKLDQKKAKEIYAFPSAEEWNLSNPKLQDYRLPIQKNGEAILPIPVNKGYRWTMDIYIYAVYESTHKVEAVVMRKYAGDVYNF